MNLERLRTLINKIYNEGLFCYEENKVKSDELTELENMTSYENISGLFYSDLAPNYVFDTTILYEKIKNTTLNKENYIKMIDSLSNNLNKIKEYELDLYCMFLGEKFNIDTSEVFDSVFKLSDEGFLAEEIYNKLLE
ncbi:hypothetical protein KTC96_08400 [Clostridium estertheticum]|uniref:hypothetical protein n=1 Tax=Clostridium estertheticum TaxID=238834 RepID=UPI001C7CD983|nr:hypothetical protein [Clostridium estertheticum]MBX4262273.1 hypothetical protein [Clostridium estertheticum]WLC71997.1 hypothetical protein KTC96_08400 [Clostridium estertheticum]